MHFYICEQNEFRRPKRNPLVVVSCREPPLPPSARSAGPPSAAEASSAVLSAPSSWQRSQVGEASALAGQHAQPPPNALRGEPAPESVGRTPGGRPAGAPPQPSSSSIASDAAPSGSASAAYRPEAACGGGGGAPGSVDPVDPTDSPASLAPPAPPASTTHNTIRINTTIQYNTYHTLYSSVSLVLCNPGVALTAVPRVARPQED